ncbi:MAG: ABC transporter ATP-binding protein [Clostridiaceae bacterium]|nr:ABC transporter ATP-binding protein [Clostridiaceae bacterium]
MTKTVEARHIGHFFAQKQVLEDVNIAIGAGEVFGLLGPSGAGKTTLIKILTGQLIPSSGESTVLGTASMGLRGEDHKQIGIMMDQFGLYERLSCYDNLLLFARIYGIPKEKVRLALEKVGLAGAAGTAASDLSKGMRSRLLLARAFMTSPKLLFLDEPTSGLDPSTAQEIYKMIFEEKSRGVTVFLTTHNMAEAEKLCDRVALLNEGRIVAHDEPKALCREFNHKKRLKVHLYNGKDIDLEHTYASAEKISSLLKNGDLETIHSSEPNLENVFMELTGRSLAV